MTMPDPTREQDICDLCGESREAHFGNQGINHGFMPKAREQGVWHWNKSLYLYRRRTSHGFDSMDTGQMEQAYNADRALICDLVAGLRAAREHIEELREAWERGVISEHDGKGGTRSNRNWQLEIDLRHLIRRAEEAERGG